MTRSRDLTVVFFVASMAWPGVVAAWAGLTPSNPRWTGTVPYALHSAGSPDLGGFAGTETVVRQGMDDWTRVSCSALTTSYEGATSSPPETRNTIAWVESYWPHDSNAIGVTTPRFSGSTLIDAAMVMNGQNFTWTTDAGSGNRVNAYSIVLHEGGHYHGLGHSSDPGATMYFAYGGGISALNDDDRTGICALYPGGGGGTTNCTTTGCPAGQICDASGTCLASEPVPGDGLTCAGCTSDAGCEGTCLAYPDSRGYCGDDCATDADCGGSNEHCEAVSDGTRHCIRRRPSDGGATCSIEAGSVEPVPEPTPDPGVGECSSSRDCAASELCNADAQCVPVPSGAIGDACEANSDCDAGLCAVDSSSDQTFCTALCDSASACPAGFDCLPIGGGMSACGPDEGGAGPGPTGPSTGASPYTDGLTGGCSATHGPPPSAPIAALGFFLVLASFRRRR
jgi:uncharacterized protein (TIGR03382 family)